ncbi:LOW QUALITY PROTEIN: hypothetical protein OSB04_un000140 [Centaurea solstitialis]|uniref:Reverse transcriptase domain-containing protein n=1 Tax=Centaurea solstitialis TaxID=347529 RepID=A0AA38SP50_9ASTR|nr:LOW QUALITY PROTEIN: hypothetical protein OSB04_un000140 [Centaurea solstitialis]
MVDVVISYRLEILAVAPRVSALAGCYTNGPLMVRGVPMFVAQWDPLKGLTKPIHDTCPLWVKLHNVPLVAFNKEGISRIASALGVPKQMDACTASICDNAWGRPGFAKVLVEIWAVGKLKREIELVIPNPSGGEGSVVTIKVEYVWEPVQCSHCLVFGHKVDMCARATKIQPQTKKNNKVDSEGFVTVERRQWKPKQADKPSSSGTSNARGQGATVGTSSVTLLPNTSGVDSVKHSEDSAKLTEMSDLHSAGSAKPSEGLVTPNEDSAKPSQGAAKPKEGSATPSEVPARPSDVLDDTLDAWDQLADPPEFSMPLKTDFVRTSRGVPEGSFRPPVNTVPKFTARRGQFVPNPKTTTVDSAAANVFSPLANLGDKEAGGGDSAASSGVAVNKGKGSADRTSSGSKGGRGGPKDGKGGKLMIHTACWNIRGLNAPEKQREVKSFLRIHSINFFAVLESHLSSQSLVSVVNNVFGHWSWVSNQNVSLHGTRIILAWDLAYMDVMVLESHAQFMHCEIRLRGDVNPWFCSVVYGANNSVLRRELWSGLRKFRAILGNKPWVLMGDFNSMLFPHDALGGVSRRNVDMVEFFECVEDIEVFDVSYTGIQHTWCQKPRDETGLRRKLDRILANVEFTGRFDDARARFHPRGISDHSPGVLMFKGGKRRRRFGFKFDNFLVDHPLFIPTVQQAWEVHVEGTFMYRITTRLKSLKEPLRKLRRSYGNLTVKVADLKVELDVIQLACDLDPFNVELKEDLEALRVAYLQACRDECVCMKQRAKVQWLNEADSNTRFYHNVVKERRHSNQVRSVCNSDGVYVHDDEVPYAFIEHLKGFLGTADVSLDPVIPQASFQNKLSLTEALHMIRPITDSDIRDAMFQIGIDKAPGSDGFTSQFFKAAWGIVGRDVTVAIHNFFYRGRLAKELNHTLICLLPKTPNASSVSDFRPISCCSVLYKCISKVVVNRMKPFLDGLVDRSQSAFIPGRRIVDNILMAHELVVGYHLNVGDPRCAFKIDLRKAYDMVDWRFLVRMLEGFGFHPVLVSWIREMVSTTTFSVVVNGESWGHFPGKRGIRQGDLLPVWRFLFSFIKLPGRNSFQKKGDPLSPYLFTLVMEGFAMIFKQCIAEASQFIHHPGCSDIALTHLCFADDLFVFTGGDVASVEVLKKALFLLRNGLSPNLTKSDVFFGNVAESEKQAILTCLPFRMGSFPIRYLGVPLSPVYLKVSDYGGLISRVKQRVQNWKMKSLSFGGRRQLVISVLQSLQLYWMAIFVFPSSVIHELEAILRSFLWAQGDEVQGKCRIAWSVVCQPRECGGLGFKDLATWNRALIAKNLWDIIAVRPTLWVSWVRNLLNHANFWIVRKSNNWSWVLRKMMDLRNIIRPHLAVAIGDGRDTHAWEDTCLDCGPLVTLISYRHIHRQGFDTSTTVREFIDTVGGNWPNEWVERHPPIANLPLPTIVDGALDSVSWRARNGSMEVFSVSTAYDSLVPPSTIVPWTRTVWFSGHIPKHAFCLWLACWNRLPTQDRLVLWKHEPPDWKCSLCGLCLDSHQHLFFECSYAATVWSQITNAIGWLDAPGTWNEIMGALIGPSPPKKFICKIALAASVYMIWKERNRRIFTSERRTEIVCAKDTIDIIMLRNAWKRMRKHTRCHICVSVLVLVMDGVYLQGPILRPEHYRDGTEILKKYVRHAITLARVTDYQLAIESRQPKVNLLRPNLLVSGIDAYSPYMPTRIPEHGVLYITRKKKERRFMRFGELAKFCDGTLLYVYNGMQSRLLADEIPGRRIIDGKGKILEAMRLIERKHLKRLMYRRVEAAMQMRARIIDEWEEYLQMSKWEPALEIPPPF